VKPIYSSSWYRSEVL